MKNTNGAPKSLQKLLADPRVTDFSDERFDENGYWVYLVPGWNYEGGHSIHEMTVRQVRLAFSSIVRCESECNCEWDKE